VRVRAGRRDLFGGAMKKFKPFMGMALVVVVFYLMYMLVPPYFNNYRLDDWMASESRLGTYGNKDVDTIRKEVVRKAAEYDVTLHPDQVIVQQDGRNTRISARYTIHVDLPFYPVDLQFTPGAETKAISGL
jgi:hypothetical protein